MATAGETLTQSGPGLMFIYLPNLFREMPGGRILMAVFFVAALFAGVTSLVNLFEAPTATLQEKLHLSRGTAVAVIGVVGLAVGLCIQGIVSGWMDVCSIYACPDRRAAGGGVLLLGAEKGGLLGSGESGPAAPSGPLVLPDGKISVLRRDGTGPDPGRCERRNRLICGNFSERSSTLWRRGVRWSW